MVSQSGHGPIVKGIWPREAMRPGEDSAPALDAGSGAEPGKPLGPLQREHLACPLLEGEVHLVQASTLGGMLSGRWRPFIRTVKRIWAWMSIACATLKPFKNIGVWCEWRIRSCIWTAFPRHRRKEACPSKPLGKRVVSKPKHSCKP